MGEGFPRPLVVGMVVAVLGVLTIAAGSSGGSGVSDGLGVALGLCAAVLYASGVLLQKLALRTVDAVTATWVGCAAGALATLPFAGQAWSEMSSVPMSDVLWVVFLGVGPTALAFTTWAYALSRADAGRMAATTLVVPALATLMSWLALGEVPTPLGFAGGALALAGVGITRLRRRPGVPPAPPTAEQGGSALEMRPSCERCGTALPPESDAARICAHECTFCAPCAEAMDGRCPNCRGVLRHRPSLIAEPG
jgi:drug/metabolite transporter (DMT)-like permease